MFLSSCFSKAFLCNRLESKALKNIVYRYIPQRSPFDKTSYIENYIPRPNKYHKTRKPRLSQWTDPKVQWPILLPPPTKLTGKALIKSIEKIERLRIKKNRTFKIAAVRPGDVVQFTYYHSLSEKKFNVYSGLVIGRTKKKSLDASFRVIFRFCGSHVEMNVKQNSPFIANFKVLARGRGNRRGKLYYLAKKYMVKEELLKPILKGKKDIKDEVKSKKTTEIMHKSTKIDKIDDPLLKKLKENK